MKLLIYICTGWVVITAAAWAISLLSGWSFGGASLYLGIAVWFVGITVWRWIRKDPT